MFRRTKNKQPAKTSAAKPAARGSSVLSVISQDTHILGTIISDGNIDFDGTVDGNIRCQNLNVRKNAVIKGDVTAELLNVYGKINGLVRAKQVNLYKDCYVEGIVMHEGLIIEEGAFLDGKCKRMDKPVVRETPIVDPDEEIAPPGSNIRLIS
jgi:cytoskeletal protein CcmA (bactofilin family)